MLKLCTGKWKGRVIRTELVNTKNNAVQLYALCVLEESPSGEKMGGHFEWAAYLTLVKTNGVVLDKQIETLKKALGWDGDPQTLVGVGNFENQEVSIVMEEEEYDGRMRFRIAWINPISSGGGVEVNVDNRATALAKLTKALGIVRKPNTLPGVTVSVSASNKTTPTPYEATNSVNLDDMPF